MISCSRNNHIISRNNKQQTGHPPPPPPLLAPQLLLSSPSNPEYRYLYDLTLGKIKGKEEEEVVGIKLNRELHLPDISKRIFIGSSQGFLISIDMFRPPTIHAFNPLTGAHFHIPNLPTPTPHPPPHLYPKSSKLHPFHRKTAITDPCIGLSSSNLYSSKAIISPCLDFIVLLPSNSEALFAPLSSSSSSSSSLMWSKLPDYHGWRDGIFHKGFLHAIDNYGNLLIYDFKNNTFPDVSSFSLSNFNVFNQTYDLQSFLVESPDGNDLFLVIRGLGEDAQFDDPRALESNSCKVLKLTYNTMSEKNYDWKKVEEGVGIRDLAFFVGPRSTSLSLDVSDRKCFPSLKSNSLYFINSWACSPVLLPIPDSVGDVGVCSLEYKGDHPEVQYIPQLEGTDHNCRLDWPPPVWYIPHPAASTTAA